MGEPIYDPLKDIELATQKVGSSDKLNTLQRHLERASLVSGEGIE